MDRQKYLLVSILLIIFWFLEYVWVYWEDVPIFYNVPFVYDGGPVRLDSWVYNVSIKLQHIIGVLFVYILTPFKKESKIMLIAFGLALIEFFFTWNEPIAKIPLPFEWWIPISTATIKLMSVCNFMYACQKKIL